MRQRRSRNSRPGTGPADLPEDLNRAVISAAVVGLGWWGRKIVHDLQDSVVLRPVLGVDPDSAARAAVGIRGLETGPSFAEALADPRVDAVVLCTPHALHADQIVAAAAAGKHVFSEKPLSTRGVDAARAVRAVREAGVQLGVGHERRFEPAVLRLQELVARGEIGHPVVIEGNFSQDKFLSLPRDNWRLSPEAAPVGPLSATGIHLVDLAISFLGPPVSTWARLSTQATQFANGDTLTVTLGFEGDRTALITAVLTTPFIGRFAVLGSQGWAEIRDRSHPEDPHGWDLTVCRRGQQPETTFFPPHPTVRDNLEAFASAASGAKPYPVTYDEMIANVCSFEAVTRSALSGKVEPVVTVPATLATDGR